MYDILDQIIYYSNIASNNNNDDYDEYVDDDGDDFEVCNYYNREVMGSQFCSEAEPYKTPEEKAEFRRSVDLDNEEEDDH